MKVFANFNFFEALFDLLVHFAKGVQRQPVENL